MLKLTNLSLINNYCTLKNSNREAIILYKHLMRECSKLPKGAEQHYKFQIKQSYKQYKDETDQQRIQEIISAAYKDIDWITKKNQIKEDMKLPLVTSGCTIPLDKFWTSIFIYHDRPHLLNKKISGVIQACFYEVSTTLKDILQYFTNSSIIYEVKKLSVLSKDNLKNLIADILSPYDKNLLLNSIEKELLYNSNNKWFISVRILIPKAANMKKCVEIVIINKNDNIMTFYAVDEQNARKIAPNFPYHLELSQTGHLRITVDEFQHADSSSADWLIDKVFSKLVGWATNDLIKDKIHSLSLLTLERYINLYQELKEKYGKKMVEIWPENTDPLKFVYEDVAIATYLICLWETIETDKKPTFLDLGCGNGLLVYILAQEGYDGCGIDVRQRKLWSLYPKNTKLLVRTIIPTSMTLFPETDWIIGNHSDELTPWIPVMALRHSFKTNFFLLPCCSYDFSGKKYSRLSTSKSQYSDYLDYIQDICNKCGFITKIDKLRIPSTKKTCIVSYGRSYKPEEFVNIDINIEKFIQSKGVEDFKPRSNVEKVQNCTQLNKDLIHRILLQVLSKLLAENVVDVSNPKLWNHGAKLSLNEIISAIEKDDLKKLKDNCGGLQTLLRNHRYIFEVEKGYVKIRIPKKIKELSKYKDKLCWFMKHHPDGCPNTSEDCAYNHIELRSEKEV